MSGIVCAIRGGVASRPTIKQAIQMAKETDLPIYFLYVLNLDFLMHTMQTHTSTISRELREMGEFILLAAQVQADQAGVTAHGVIREGHVVREEIIGLCAEVDADYVVLGRPRTARKESLFTEDLMDEFAQRVETETRARVVFPAEEG